MDGYTLGGKQASRLQIPAAPWHLEQSVERLVAWAAGCGAASVSVGPRGGDGFKVHLVIVDHSHTVANVSVMLTAVVLVHGLSDKTNARLFFSSMVTHVHDFRRVATRHHGSGMGCSALLLCRHTFIGTPLLFRWKDTGW